MDGLLRRVLVLPAAAAVIGGLLITVWLFSSDVTDVEARIPTEYPRLTTRPQTTERRNTGTLIPGAGTPADDLGSWPQFRGAERSNLVRDVGNLARSWPADGPRVLWRLEVGEGHAGAAIHNGRVYLIDYDRDKQEDAIRCLSFEDGREIWRYTYYVLVKRYHGMSRTVPAVNDDYVVTLGPKCHLHCLDASTGELVWKMDLVKQFGTEVPPWYAGQCPLIEGDRVVLAPGGEPLMMTVELDTGRIIWSTPNPGDWGMTHSSIIPMDYNGSRQYIYCTTKGVVGVSAKDGKLLWTKPDWKVSPANIPSPVVVGSERIFLSGGYHKGSVMIRLKGAGENLETEEVFRLKHKVFGADQHTPILYKNRIYGLVAPRGPLACLDLEGNLIWSSGAAHKFGLGPFLLADGMLFVLDDQEGTLHLVEADPNRYRELAQAKILQGHDAWAPMAMASGKLILRDLTEMVCVEVPEG